MDLDYLKDVDFKKFPRDADGNLKVSEATRERVEAYLLAQQADPMAAHLIGIIESRCNTEGYTHVSAIVLGLDSLTKYRVYACLGRMSRFYKIQRRTTKGGYSYRLLRNEAETKILQSIGANQRRSA